MNAVAHTRHTQISERIPLINGLRGIAMIAVLVAHTVAQVVRSWEHMFTVGPLPFFPMTLVTNGLHGVTLFFLLSGFVLALPYCTGRRSMCSLKDLRHFYVRRWKRLAPLYIVVSATGLLMFPPNNPFLVLFLYATGSFIFTNEYFFPHENGILWSLGVEIWLSILLPFFLFFRSRHVLYVLAAASVLLALSVQYYAAYHVWLHPFATGIPVRLSTFLLGVVLAERYANKRAPFPAGFAVGCILLFFFFQMTSFCDAILRFSRINMLVRLALYPSIVTGVGIASFLCIDGLLNAPRSWVRACLETWSLQMVGLMCYSMYVWHILLMNAMDALHDAPHFAAYLLVLVIVSWFSYVHIECRSVPDVRMILPGKGSGR